MRAAGILRFVCALAVIAALASCGPRPYRGGTPHDTDVVIWLEAPATGTGPCTVLKSDATAGFHGQRVTWHVRGNCQSLDNQPITSQTLSLTFDDNASPSADCPQQRACTRPITRNETTQMIASDLQVRIDDKAARGWYHITLMIGTRTIDPDLQIDP